MPGWQIRFVGATIVVAMTSWATAVPSAAQSPTAPTAPAAASPSGAGPALGSGPLWLPAPAGTELLVVQGPDTGDAGGNHTGVARYAVDLATSDGGTFEVAAARPGVVALVRDDALEDACPGAEAVPPPACWTEANYVVVDHLDGTAALYLHLAQGSTTGLVPGTSVAQGQVLGLAGTSGTSPEPQLHFMLMAGAAATGDPPWWRQSIGPLAFADESVLAVHPDGIVGSGLEPDGPFVSGNPGPGEPADASGEPVARPAGLPARLPWAAGEEHVIVTGDDLVVPDPGGTAFEVVGSTEGDPVSSSTLAYPLFGGTLLYAGCATGWSAPLGRIVVVGREADGRSYQAVHAHLSSLDPLLEAAMADVAVGGEPLELRADQSIGTFGSSVTAADGTCDGVDGGPDRLRVALFQDALVSPGGTIAGGTPVEPWPFVGSTLVAPTPWWSGPMRAIDITDEAGSPRATWSGSSTADRSHVTFGDPVRLAVRARDASDIREVRFLATYPDWPVRRGLRRFSGLDPEQTWRLVAVCRPPGTRGQPRSTKGCSWEGDARSAVVTYDWDPTAAQEEALVPWLPAARPAITDASEGCVPATLAVEVADAAGYRLVDERVRVAEVCDARGQRLGRTVNLDPPGPPEAPTRARLRCTSPGEFECTAWEVSWRDMSDNEDGFRVVATDVTYLDGRCREVSWRGSLPLAEPRADAERWAMDPVTTVRRISRAIEDQPVILSFSTAVEAWNESGASDRTLATGSWTIDQSGGGIDCVPG